MSELRKFSEIRIGKFFVCSSFEGKFLKVMKGSAFSFQNNVTQKINSTEKVRIIPIQITLAEGVEE